MIFPVLVISFLKPARARVLQGYFDGTLKIQFTKLYDFNVPIYTDLMNCLLRWGYANPHGNTTLGTSLPVISEDADDDDTFHGKMDTNQLNKIFLLVLGRLYRQIIFLIALITSVSF
ncbi:hypothetical protein VTN96DRAFT_8184 [Rasamsonia emersonii]